MFYTIYFFTVNRVDGILVSDSKHTTGKAKGDSKKIFEDKIMFIAWLTQIPGPNPAYITDRSGGIVRIWEEDSPSCSCLVTAPSKLELYQKLRKLGLAPYEIKNLVHELPPESTTICLRSGERW